PALFGFFEDMSKFSNSWIRRIGANLSCASTPGSGKFFKFETLSLNLPYSMKRYLQILFSASILIFTSCEDKENSNKREPENQTESTVTTPEPAKTKQAPNNQKKEDQWVNIDGPLITQEELIPFLTEYGKENPEDRVRIITRFGDIEVLLYKDTPLHRANFIYLVKLGYFDNTFFHRVAQNFVVQGGNSDNTDTPRKRTKIGSYLIPS